MVREEIKRKINEKAYHTIREIRRDYSHVRISDDGTISLHKEGWKVWVSKIGGVYRVAAIEEIKNK
jgi:hypothetical protein